MLPSGQFENDRVVYENAVRGNDTQMSKITHLRDLEMAVVCHMEKDSISQIMYEAKGVSNFTISGTGRFNTTMAFYTSAAFVYQIYDDPYVVSINQNMFVQVRLRRLDDSLVLALDTCVATPNPHDYSDDFAYFLLVNG